MYKLIFFLVFFLVINNLVAQEDTLHKETTWEVFKKDGSTIFGGVKYAFTQPLKWKKKDWLTFGGIAAGTTLLYFYDEETSDYFINQSAGAPQMLKEIGWYYGSPQNIFMISAGIYSYGLFAKNEKFRHTGVLIISSAIATGLIQSITKNAFGRARPTEEVGSRVYKPFNNEGAYYSFPSGHAILSFTVSHAVAKQFDNIWVKGGIYAFGLITPVSRLWKGAHWLTDVTFGMVLGVVVVEGIDNFLTNKKSKKEEKNISWNIKAGARTIGIVGTF